MQQLWANETGSFDGEFVSFSPSFSWPKPVQSPHPPILMGRRRGPVTFKHIAEYCDGWMPIHGRADISPKVDELRAAWAAAGRNADALQLGIFGCPGKVDTIERYRDAGSSRVVLGLPPAPADKVLPVLDSYASVIEHFAR